MNYLSHRKSIRAHCKVHFIGEYALLRTIQLFVAPVWSMQLWLSSLFKNNFVSSPTNLKFHSHYSFLLGRKSVRCCNQVIKKCLFNEVITANMSYTFFPTVWKSVSIWTISSFAFIWHICRWECFHFQNELHGDGWNHFIGFQRALMRNKHVLLRKSRKLYIRDLATWMGRCELKQTFSFPFAIHFIYHLQIFVHDILGITVFGRLYEASISLSWNLQFSYGFSHIVPLTTGYYVFLHLHFRAHMRFCLLFESMVSSFKWRAWGGLLILFILAF